MKRMSLLAALLALAACNGNGGGNAATSNSNVTLDTEEHKTLYALGLALARNTQVFNLTADDAQYVVKGFDDAVSGAKPQVELQTYGPKIQQLAQSRMKARSAAEKEKGKQTLDAAAAEPGAEKLPSGVVIKVLTPGTGATPTATDTVKVNYEGKLADGKVFDSSYKRNAPATFRLNQVVPCWTQALQKMKVGEKAQITCPSDVAYGDMGKPPEIPGGATLIFTVELLDVTQTPANAMPQMPFGNMGGMHGMPPHMPPPKPGQPGQPVHVMPAPGSKPAPAPTHAKPSSGAPVHH